MQIWLSFPGRRRDSLCTGATTEEFRGFIEAEIELGRATADDAALRRVMAVERREEASIVGTVEWVLRDDTNPFGDTAIGLTRQEKTVTG